MNKRMLTVALGAMALSAAVPALAQETKPVGLSVRAGLFFPSNKAARDEDKTWFTGGLEYKLKDLNLGTTDTMMRSHLSLSADFISKGNFKNTPVLLNWVASQNEVYYSVGAGLGFIEVPKSGGGSKSDTKLAYSLAVGYNFQQGRSPLFVEARYFGTQESKLNGFAVELGIRL